MSDNLGVNTRKNKTGIFIFLDKTNFVCLLYSRITEFNTRAHNSEMQKKNCFWMNQID